MADVPEDIQRWTARRRVALVLVAHASGRANPWTILSSELSFWGRVGHGVTYIAALVSWRTVAFSVAVVGEWMIVLQLLPR